MGGLIQAIGFLDTSLFAATFVTKYRARMQDGILKLRDTQPDVDTMTEVAFDLPILEEWKQARLLLDRIKVEAQKQHHAPGDLGRAWLETLPGGHGTPWTVEEDDYAQAHVRTRTTILFAPNAYTYSGAYQMVLAVGFVNVVEHRVLCSEANFSEYPRTHLIVDVRRPDEPEGD